MSLVRAEKQETARPTRPRAASTRCYVDLTPPPQHIRTNHLGHDLVYGRKLPRGVIRCASAPPIQIIARVDGATTTLDADAESTVGDLKNAVEAKLGRCLGDGYFLIAGGPFQDGDGTPLGQWVRGILSRQWERAPRTRRN